MKYKVIVSLCFCLLIISFTACKNTNNLNKSSKKSLLSSSTKIKTTMIESKTTKVLSENSIDFENERLAFEQSIPSIIVGDGKGAVYYRSEMDNWCLYKAKIDGSDKIKICDDVADKINVLDDYIYYTNFKDNFNVYRIKTDGSDRQKLIDTYCANLLVTENYMYMCLRDEKNNSNIYRSKLDGSNLELLISGMSLRTYYNGVIYCDDVDNLYSFDLRNRELKKIVEEYTYYVSADDNGIYFWQPNKGEYCMLDKNGEIKTLVKGGDYFTKYRDKVYFVAYSKDERYADCIYYKDLKSGTEKKLYEFSDQYYDLEGKDIAVTKADYIFGKVDEKYLDENGELNALNDTPGLLSVVDGVLFSRATFRENIENRRVWECWLKVLDDGKHEVFD